MGGIHCMFTSANKPFDSVCLFVLVLLIESALLLSTCWLCCEQLHASERHDKVQKTLLNERTFLAGFFSCFFFSLRTKR